MTLIHPTQIALEIPPEVQAGAWTLGQTADDPAGHWQIYLNQICRQTLIPWLQAEQEPNAEPWIDPGRWVNGTGINLGEKRLVFIPDKSIDDTELRLPQEWVDIPNWIADYYLAVQVDIAGDALRIWGYTTHEQIKTQGHYDPDDRTYSLSAPALIEDLSVLWTVRQLYPDETTQVAIAPLTALSESELSALRFPPTPAAHLRLALPLNQWNCFLERSDWHQHLTASKPQRNHLGQWLENLFAEGWEAIDRLLGSQPALAFRNSEVMDQQIQRAKVIHLRANAVDHSVLLVLSVGTTSDGRISIKVQLFPANTQNALPSELQLTMLSSSGNVVQTVAARAIDNFIQLKTFRCATGTAFSLQVSIPGISFTEDFIA